MLAHVSNGAFSALSLSLPGHSTHRDPYFDPFQLNPPPPQEQHPPHSVSSVPLRISMPMPLLSCLTPPSQRQRALRSVLYQVPPGKHWQRRHPTAATLAKQATLIRQPWAQQSPTTNLSFEVSSFVPTKIDGPMAAYSAPYKAT